MSDDQPRVGSAAWLRENDPEKHQRQLDQARKYRETHKEERAAWRAANRERLREQSAQWKRDNPDRSRQLNRESMRRAAARQREEAEKQRALAQKKRAKEQERARDPEKFAKQREAERERLRQYRENNPEKVRESQRRWREKNPERAKEQARAGSQAYRDRNADAQRAVNRDAARARREADPDYHKRQYAKNIEASRARSREKNQLRNRLKELGLPPRQSHRVYADQKRSNARAADEFFTRGRDVRSLNISESPYRSERLAWDQSRRTRLREIAEISPAAAEATRIEGRDAALHTMLSHRDFLADTQALREKVIPKIRDDIRMDIIAARARGREYDPRAEFHRRVEAAIVERGPAVLRSKLAGLTQSGVLDLSRRGDREALDRLVKQHYRAALRLTDPELVQREPAPARSNDQARWWGVDADHRPTRTPGEITARTVKDAEATAIAHDIAKTRDRGRGLER